MFAEERPALLPLPVVPFRYYQFGTRTVHLDGCVEVDYAYAPPPGWLGRDLAVQWDGCTSGCCIPPPASCCASTAVSRPAITRSAPKIGPGAHRPPR
jgi:hypothetical protein